MPYRIVKGTVSIDGKSPDGDTIAFKIDNPEEWIWPRTQGGRFPKFNAKYQANIRFEAIDALELHFTIQNVYPQIKVSQPIELAKQARDRLLDIIGFDRTIITESANYRISDPQQQKLPVTLAYNGIDPFGRLIGFVFTEGVEFEVSDKQPTVLLMPDDVVKSVNAKLLGEGLVYPTYYGGLYPTLRNALSKLSTQARSQSLGVWESHKDAFIFERKPNIEEIESIVMLPKLFRRLATHLGRNGAISNFRNFLRQKNDLTVDTRDVRLSNYSSFVRTKKLDDGRYKLWMSHRPEDLIFVGG